MRMILMKKKRKRKPYILIKDRLRQEQEEIRKKRGSIEGIVWDLPNCPLIDI